MTPTEAIPAPEAAEEETVVVQATESATVTESAIAVVASTEAYAPVFYVPAMFETASAPAAVPVADVEPLVMAINPVDESESSGLMQSWWQRGAAMLIVCLGALAPFSSRRARSRDEAAWDGLTRQ